MNLIYLGKRLDRAQWLDQAESTIRSVTTLLQQSPSSVPRMLIAIDRYLDERPDREQKPLADEEPPPQEPGPNQEDDPPNS